MKNKRLMGIIVLIAAAVIGTAIYSSRQRQQGSK